MLIIYHQLFDGDSMSDSFLALMIGRRDAKRAERERVDAEIKQLDELIREYMRQSGLREEPISQPAHQSPTQRPGALRSIVFDILEQHPEGISTNDLVGEASRVGHSLSRGSVASLLSVQAKRGAVEYDNGVYRISKEEAPAAPTAEAPDFS